ncbi:CcmD family protein [Salisaeta longa]|uniref:CcmD family protein n=1 Tax=Salisaeta longa TaxID=503170 RepID=UPI00040214AE|nr:hypothetical protein [Salisaeta longa]
MTIHPLPQQAPADSAVYDSVWTEQPPVRPSQSAFEQTMMQDGKIYVVVAVLVLILLGLLAFVFRTDRKIAKLERRVDAGDSNDTL